MKRFLPHHLLPPPIFWAVSLILGGALLSVPALLRGDGAVAETSNSTIAAGTTNSVTAPPSALNTSGANTITTPQNSSAAPPANSATAPSTTDSAVVPPEKLPFAPLLNSTLLKTATGVTFLTRKTQLWLGRSQILCFYSKQTYDTDRTFPLKVDEKFVHVLSPPSLLRGANIGYVRIQPLKEGQTEISLDNSPIDVRIVKDMAASALAPTRPEIITPSSASVVWGKFAVGVEELNFSSISSPVPPVLRLPDGRELPAQAVPGQQPGPHLHYVFTVDAATLAPGENELLAVGKDDSGREVVSEPVDIVAINPDPASIVSGDCKDQINTLPPPPKLKPDKNLAAQTTNAPSVAQTTNAPSVAQTTNAPSVAQTTNASSIAQTTNALSVTQTTNAPSVAQTTNVQTKRVKKFVPPTVVNDDKSVFGPIVICGGNRSPWRMSITVPSNGLYQMFVTARGDFGGNALPTVEALVDELRKDSSSVRLATTDWQRVPVGRPLSLEEGTHVISIPFRNNFASGPFDKRCLYLARYELARLDQTSEPVLAANGSGSTMMQEAAMQPGQTSASPMQAAASTTTPPASAPTMQETASTTTPPASAPTMQETASTATPPDSAPMTHASASAQTAPSTVPPKKGKGKGKGGNLPSGALYVVFKDALQGQVVTGRVQINGLCWWANRNQPPPPKVDLLVNGKVVASQTSPQPQFQVDASAFQPGENKIQLSGQLPSGQHAQSLVESVFVPAAQPQPAAAKIVYPAAGAKVGLADAVVADVSGDKNMVNADLLIDGQPQHLNFAPQNGLGPILFPLLTRGLPPGVHRLQVTVQDTAGNSASSGEVKVMVTADQDPDGKYARAVFLLNRFGYGPEPRELAAILTKGAHDWLASRLDETIDSPTEENESERLHAEFPDTNAVAMRAMQYLITDANPVRARFVMWTENHFSTWLSKDTPAEKSREHDRFLDLGVAPFPDLLLASATSPAMLIYLDQRQSVSKKLNENYAREIMELHTLGVKGGYTQTDVTTLADLLTGWTLADEAPLDGANSNQLQRTFRYDPYLNSGTSCRVLGMEFPQVPPEQRFDRVLSALNMLTAHPSCAYFISRKLLEHYVSDPAPPDLVNDLAQIYLETGGDVRAMLLALPGKPAFWAAPARVASPIDYGVHLARMAGQVDPKTVVSFATNSGMGLFDRASPDGYPEADGYFASSNGLLQRWHFAQTVQNDFIAHGLIPDDWKPADQQWTPDATQRVIDLAAVRISGNVLTDSSNTAAMQLLASANANTDGRLHLLATFLCQIPETSLR